MTLMFTSNTQYMHLHFCVTENLNVKIHFTKKENFVHPCGRHFITSTWFHHIVCNALNLDMRLINLNLMLQCIFDIYCFLFAGTNSTWWGLNILFLYRKMDRRKNKKQKHSNSWDKWRKCRASAWPARALSNSELRIHKGASVVSGEMDC